MMLLVFGIGGIVYSVYLNFFTSCFGDCQVGLVAMLIPELLAIVLGLFLLDVTDVGLNR